MARRALVELPVAFIQTGAAHPFIVGLLDREVKQHLLMGGDRTLNEALNQALKLEAATRPPAKLRELTGVTPRASQPSDRRGRDDLCAGNASPPLTCAETAGEGRVKRETRYRGKRVNAGEERGPPLSPAFNPRFTLNILGRGTNDSLNTEGCRESHIG